MNTLILTTKLHIPRYPQDFVSRPQLLERLSAGISGKLTLISAPAGFGKTALVSAWVQQEGLGARVTWLSLDEGDNDLARFLIYLVAALNQVDGIDIAMGEGALSILQTPQPDPLPVETILTALINGISAVHQRVVLVLDDYHTIQAPLVDDAVAFLLEHLPQELHVVIVTREDPSLPLPRLRALGKLTELRATDLRFTTSEAADFLHRVMGLDLSEGDIVALERRTEGWIAGLQLAAISMRGHDDASGFIRSFSGSNRYVLDYLVEEVLEQQSELVEAFLVQTSILDRLTGPLCDALTNRDDGQVVLETLERGNMFIVPLDNQRRWYRYHHLFSDLLRRRPMRPGQVAALHLRASRWYEQEGYIDDAIEHALHATEFQQVAFLLEEHIDALWQSGEHAKLRRWLAMLPDPLLHSRPQLCIFHAWYLFARGEEDAAKQHLQIVETKVAEQHDLLSHAQRTRLLGRAAAIRSVAASYKGDVQGIIQHARQALDWLPAGDALQSAAAIALGNAYGFSGDMATALEVRQRALEAGKGGENTYFSVLAHLEVAITLREMGRLRRTVEICQQQVAVAERAGLARAPVVGCLLAIWGETLAEQGELREGLRLVSRGVELTKPGDLAMFGWSHLCLLRVLFSARDEAAIQGVVQQIEQLDRRSDLPPWLTVQVAAWQARLWLLQGRLQAPWQWACERKLIVAGEPAPVRRLDFFTLNETIVLARILIAQKRFDQAMPLLQQMQEAAQAGDRTARVVEVLGLQALAGQASGDLPKAMAALQQALVMAEPAAFVQTFVDEGLPMADLLWAALAQGIVPDYVRRLLAAFPAADQAVTGQPQRASSENVLVEPLSEREIEVLQLIATGLTNREIAARLFLSLNTVKVHTRNIYGKLGVHNRTQAGAQARALGILPAA